MNKIKDNSSKIFFFFFGKKIIKLLYADHETAIGCMKEVVELLLQAEYETCKYDGIFKPPFNLLNNINSIFFFR